VKQWGLANANYVLDPFTPETLSVLKDIGNINELTNRLYTNKNQWGSNINQQHLEAILILILYFNNDKVLLGLFNKYASSQSKQILGLALDKLNLRIKPTPNTTIDIILLEQRLEEIRTQNQLKTLTQNSKELATELTLCYYTILEFHKIDLKIVI
jgi:hypothetical protein